MENAAAGFERVGPLVAVRYGKAVPLAAAERRFDHVPEPRGVDHHFAEATGRQAFEVIFDEPLAADAQQRFRLAIGERTHAFAAPGGEDHRLHDLLTMSSLVFSSRGTLRLATHAWRGAPRAHHLLLRLSRRLRL